MTAPRLLGVAVVVPARDESDLIERCLASIAVAREQLKGIAPEVRVVTVVVADACTDDTADRARRAPDVVVIETAGRAVGMARAAGVDEAMRHLAQLGVDGSSVWIANTDADSAVPPRWLTVQVELADDGADVMVGTVRPDFADLDAERIAAWTARHTPGRPNGHVHGANLGMHAIAYRRAGGFDPLDLHEDVVLVQRLRDSGAVVTASDAGEVLTSGRSVGRTPGGYAGYLALDLLGQRPVA
ncbi:hypothetical protein ASF17_09175 [Frigoribacterium sp. Leaf263]|uniref:glycosyltransferase n=1 Tax=Frigoribacterium sp. Leaf263 TaxID=1736313 RepID=UPI0006FD00D6|nr:glycosyltransferase [Frigoribacterium sp. Leaf263]KQO81374.1 hypothetical protein ASF17_09175 [Frigoribacterium sp. Leaf263]